MLHWIYTSKLPFLFLILLILFYSVSWTSFITCRISWRLLFLSCLCTDNNTGLHPGEFLCAVFPSWPGWTESPSLEPLDFCGLAKEVPNLGDFYDADLLWAETALKQPECDPVGLRAAARLNKRGLSPGDAQMSLVQCRMFTVRPLWCFRVKTSSQQFTRGDPSAQTEVSDSFQLGLQPEAGELRGHCTSAGREHKLRPACMVSATSQNALKCKFTRGRKTHLLQWSPGVAWLFGEQLPAFAAAAALLEVGR